MLSPSPFPLLISMNAFNILFSFLLMLKLKMILPFSFSLILISYASFFWWKSYCKEFTGLGFNSLSLEEGLKFSMILFISSEVFFFFSFFWSYFHYLLSPCMEIGMSWPSEGLKMFEFQNVPLFNTVVLLSSGITLTVSHDYLIKNFKNLSLVFLTLTFTLGIVFTALQGLEYSSSFFSINDGSFGTSFFVLTGFHGIHVIIGTTYLFYVFLSMSGQPSSTCSNIKFEMASWYWHFVDVVWIFLYFFLYYVNG